MMLRERRFSDRLFLGCGTKEQTCPRCDSRHLKKNGTTAQGKQRYRCKQCGRQFLFVLSYTYRTCIPLLRELIVPRTLNGSGVRDMARVLQISPNTVLHLRVVGAANSFAKSLRW